MITLMKRHIVHKTHEFVERSNFKVQWSKRAQHIAQRRLNLKCTRFVLSILYVDLNGIIMVINSVVDLILVYLFVYR